MKEKKYQKPELQNFTIVVNELIAASGNCNETIGNGSEYDSWE